MLINVPLLQKKQRGRSPTLATLKKLVAELKKSMAAILYFLQRSSECLFYPLSFYAPSLSSSASTVEAWCDK